MKRGLLIGVGTLGGLGAVFAITPPQFGTGIGGGGARATLSGGAATQAAPAQTQAAAPAPAAPAPAATTTKKTAKKTTKSSTTSSAAPAPAQTQSAAPAPAQTQSAAPAPAPSKPSTPAPAAKTGVSGTFVGGTAQTRWGPVQVQINVKDGIITSVDPLQYPMSNGTDQYINKQAIPLLNGEVKNMSLATAMAEATKYLNGDPNATVGVGGASYTSSGYLVSMQSAIKKAGL